MFWGINIKSNRKYSQVTKKSFHISQAALEADSPNATNQVFLNVENQKFLLCTLRKDICEQVMLDLNFSENEKICFQSVGTGNVSLSGYIIEDPSDFMNGTDDEDQEGQEAASSKKSKLKEILNASNDDDDDDDEDDSDFEGDINDDDDIGMEEEADEEDDDDDDELDVEESDKSDDEDEDDDDEEGSDEEDPAPKAKQIKLDKANKQENGVVKELAAKAAAAGADKKNKKNKKNKKENQEKQENKQTVGAERLITGGVRIEDIRIGNGAEAVSGKRAQVYYEGRLKSNNKVFDSTKQGAGLKFAVGRGEVIKGWDVGVVGMKVGGKRRITCPPHMAYGSRGSPPVIPPNSTLVFEVELKSVN